MLQGMSFVRCCSKRIHKILAEFVNKDKTDQENTAEEWFKAIDQGGLTRITTDTLQLFYAIETCVRRHLISNKWMILFGNISQTVY